MMVWQFGGRCAAWPVVWAQVLVSERHDDGIAAAVEELRQTFKFAIIYLPVGRILWRYKKIRTKNPLCALKF